MMKHAQFLLNSGIVLIRLRIPDGCCCPISVAGKQWEFLNPLEPPAVGKKLWTFMNTEDEVFECLLTKNTPVLQCLIWEATLRQ